jgi:hypothetical protein
MAPPKRSKPAEESEGEFSDIDGSNVENSSDEEVQIENNTLTWVCPVVRPHATRNEFEAVSGQLCTKL